MFEVTRLLLLYVDATECVVGKKVHLVAFWIALH